ncbi:hypothetical protein M2373_001916 [Chryseobacterium sp. JUb7]|nr:hypothetical protein [Chryseobacterium sp. JUb7]
MIFIVMSLLNAQFSEWSVRFLHLPGGNFGMYSYLILIFCSVITLIGLVTVIIFRKSYHSILRIAILFEVIYFFFLIISGNNPFLYFSDANNENLLMIIMYANSIVVFLIIYLIHILYSKIISSKSKKLT